MLPWGWTRNVECVLYQPMVYGTYTAFLFTWIAQKHYSIRCRADSGEQIVSPRNQCAAGISVLGGWDQKASEGNSWRSRMLSITTTCHCVLFSHDRQQAWYGYKILFFFKSLDDPGMRTITQQTPELWVLVAGPGNLDIAILTIVVRGTQGKLLFQ